MRICRTEGGWSRVGLIHRNRVQAALMASGLIPKANQMAQSEEERRMDKDKGRRRGKGHLLNVDPKTCGRCA